MPGEKNKTSGAPLRDDPASRLMQETPMQAKAAKPDVPKPREIGGPSGPEPTRYGDWERNGRVSDF